MKILFSVIGFFFFSCTVHAQGGGGGTSNSQGYFQFQCSIKYTYDASGNRAHREYSCGDVWIDGPVSNKPAATLNTDSSNAALVSILFPNPNNGIFTIKTSKDVQQGNVKIYSIDGKLIKEFPYSGTSSTFDIRNFANGQFTIRLYDGDFPQIFKLEKIE
jgi:Secretion system C-terminal sorting domain